MESQYHPLSLLNRLRAALETWSAQHDPNYGILRRAARAVIVSPLVFFAANHLVHRTPFTLFAVFGSLATLLLVSFSGSRREQCAEAATMLATQLILICLGTVVSRILWLAAPLTVLITFSVFALGSFKPSSQKTVTPILVAFFLATTAPVALNALPDRVGGWFLAGIVSLLAIPLLWPLTGHTDSDEVSWPEAWKRMRNLKAELTDHPERSVKPLQNALRTATALTLAVLLAHSLNAQRALWVILSSLTVLCSSAVGTRQNVIRALIGTVIGIAFASGLIALLGTDTTVCWLLLPFVILFTGLAPLTPSAISFQVGQIGFTTLLLLISNITTPIGWRIGIIRLQDVLLGCSVSLVVGAIFWPHEPVKTSLKR